LESLALRWFEVLRVRRSETEAYAAGGEKGPDRGQLEGERRRAEELLALAAERACPRAAYVWARDLIRRGKAEEGIKRLSLIIKGDAPGTIKALAYRTLAVEAEWRLGDPRLALDYVDRFLVRENTHSGLYGDMQKRRERLLKKLKSDRRPE
jgi:hypothetical protein